MNDSRSSKQLREIIRILERKLGILEDTEFSCCNITLAQCHALVEIGRTDHISLNELSERLGLENSTMSRTVNNLVTSGMVKRQEDQQDRRYIAIALTEDGRQLFEQIESSMSVYYEEILNNIPQSKREQVLESLALLAEAVNKSSCCMDSCCK